jgi:glycosyltransferase involved in cell wall biosynthesis
MCDPLLTVVLAGFNERQALPAAIEAYRDALARCGIGRYEILIVNDGSTDGTGSLAEEMARGDPRIRVLHNEHNLGQVASLLRGFAEARGRILTWNGMDLPFDPSDTPRALACFDGGADMVVVERSGREAYGIVRKLVSWSNVLLVRWLFGSPFRDHNFVQFYRREVLESIRVRSAGVSTVTAEVILRALRRGYRVVGIRAEYHERKTGKSTITPGKVLHAFLETLRLWLLMRTPDRGDPSRPRRRRTPSGGS